MKPVTIYDRNDHLGDALCCLPCIIEKSKSSDINIYLSNNTSKDILRLCNIPNINILNNVPIEYDYELQIIKAWLDYYKLDLMDKVDRHMIQGFYPQLDLDIPDLNTIVHPIYTLKEKNILSPNISSLKDYVLISPFSYSDNIHHHKEWYEDKWNMLLNHLEKQNKHILLVGTSKDKHCSAYKIFERNNVSIVLDPSTLGLLRLVNSVKYVLSIDNGISHMAMALKMPHILLHGVHMPLCWAGNPNSNAIIIRKRLKDISLEDVLAAIYDIEWPEYPKSESEHD